MGDLLTFTALSRHLPPNVLWTLCGCVLFGICAGCVGSFIYLKKQSLASDALAHAALPGVTTAFMLTFSREPLVLFLGALLSCALGYVVLETLPKITKLKEDVALAIVLSLFFAGGIFQLSLIQRSGVGSQSGLDRLLFGQAASITRSDIVQIALLACAALASLSLLFKGLSAVCFDRVYATARGVKCLLYDGALAVIAIATIVSGLQLVGVVLVSAMLIIPVAAARCWATKLSHLVLLSAVGGGVSSLIGVSLSWVLPNMPTGPWIVTICALWFCFSLLCAPKRGLLRYYLSERAFAQRIDEENIIRAIFKSGEDNREHATHEKGGNSPAQLLALLKIKRARLYDALARLKKHRFVFESSGNYVLSSGGMKLGEVLTTRHRLWELYLAERAGFKAHLLHADAEEAEHLITAELEKLLREELGEVRADPHGRAINKGEVP